MAKNERATALFNQQNLHKQNDQAHISQLEEKIKDFHHQNLKVALQASRRDKIDDNQNGGLYGLNDLLERKGRAQAKFACRYCEQSQGNER